MPRQDLLIKGAHTLTMDASLGGFPAGDVLIRDGRIAAVGPTGMLDAAGAEVIDGTDMIAMPGFVETHWHMWNGVLRGLTHDAKGYFAMTGRTAGAFTAQDHYDAVRYAALEAVSAGITTVHNWTSSLKDFADAEAEMRALVDSGLRARFGYCDSFPLVQKPLTVDDLRRAKEWEAEHGDGRLTLGLAIHNGAALADEIKASRELGLPTIGLHADYSKHPELVGPDCLFTHGAGAPPEQLRHVAQSGMKVSLCPATDPLIGAGYPPLQQLLEAGVPFEDISFSVDVTAQTPADPFASVRILCNAARVAQRGPGASFDRVVAEDLFGAGPPVPLFPPRKILELGTLNGAKVLGLGAITGSLTPGKRADLILVRTGDPNMIPAPGADPAFQLVQHAAPANVDTVVVDGRVLKMAGRMVNLNPGEVVRRAAEVQRAICERTGLVAQQAGA
ncbi:hypothetical protein DFJ74DRAFT_608158 [Hyaloraphidium curvatum]|nr:hypothetical protein DFJ74DRAFT_608158 [Hyaloraphidium curvatum]